MNKVEKFEKLFECLEVLNVLEHKVLKCEVSASVYEACGVLGELIQKEIDKVANPEEEKT
jgi:hypothetical protein